MEKILSYEEWAESKETKFNNSTRLVIHNFFLRKK